MLKAALSGNYVNFGVFRLYGDGALHDALQTFVKLLLSITQSDLLVRLSFILSSVCSLDLNTDVGYVKNLFAVMPSD